MNTRRTFALSLSGVLMVSLMAIAAAPTDAHTCSGTWDYNCGSCTSGTHTHYWTLPVPGGCTSYTDAAIRAVQELVNG